MLKFSTETPGMILLEVCAVVPDIFPRPSNAARMNIVLFMLVAI